MTPACTRRYCEEGTEEQPECLEYKCSDMMCDMYCEHGFVTGDDVCASKIVATPWYNVPILWHVVLFCGTVYNTIISYAIFRCTLLYNQYRCCAREWLFGVFIGVGWFLRCILVRQTLFICFCFLFIHFLSLFIYLFLYEAS